MKIRVVGFQSQAIADSPWTEFGEQGGTLGRAPENTLCLPDPERHVSRIHASVVCIDGAYFIKDQGSALPIRLNGRALGQGNQAKLADGDELEIGAYRLSVRVDFPASSPPSPPAAFAPASTLVSASVPPPQAHVPPPGGSLIPDDFDPFAAHAPANAAPPAAASPQAAAAPSIDDLFGLSGVSAEPLAMTGALSDASAEARSQPTGLAPEPPSLATPPQQDQVAEIHAAFLAPKPIAPEAATPEPPAAPVGKNFYVSWKEDEPGTRTTSRRVVDIGQEALAELEPAITPPPAAAPAETPPAAPVEPPPTTPAAVVASVPNDLAQALLEGLGMSNLPMPEGLTPTFMYNLGVLLRESTQGTLDLLLARAMTKREIRADATLMLGKENNPLKFSPTVEFALTHLLAPISPGFMGPQAAMRDAYADLRAHQFGFMAGMRAALAGVLSRFDPANLEQRLSEKTMLDKLLSMNRRARLWELYIQLYGDISQEVEEDFHTVFGKEFLRAYEQQVELLRKQPET